MQEVYQRERDTWRCSVQALSILGLPISMPSKRCLSRIGVGPGPRRICRARWQLFVALSRCKTLGNQEAGSGGREGLRSELVAHHEGFKSNFSSHQFFLYVSYSACLVSAPKEDRPRTSQQCTRQDNCCASFVLGMIAWFTPFSLLLWSCYSGELETKLDTTSFLC